MHLRSLEAFDFDSVLFPWNHTMLENPAYRTDAFELARVCRERNVGMQTIKSIAVGRWPADFDGPKFSWYEALEDADAIGRAVRHVLGEDDLFLNTTSDARKLSIILEAAAAANATTKPSPAEMEADVASFAITPLFDGAELERI
jgi:hypothetical protein